jgi:hypothetical protein
LARVLAAVVLVVVLPSPRPSAAHEAEPNVRLEIYIDWVDNQLFEPTCSFCTGERVEMNFVVGKAERTCEFNLDTGRYRDSDFEQLARHFISFEAGYFDAVSVGYTLAVALNSAHVLCVHAWGRELDTWDPDDPIRLATHHFSQAEHWGEGAQNLITPGGQGDHVEIHYAIGILESPPEIVPAEPATVRVGMLLPDLRIMSIRASKREDGSRPCEGDDRNYIIVQVRNVGTAAAGRFIVAVLPPGDLLEAPVDGLARDAQTEVRVRAHLETGELVIRAVADAYSDVQESNETNNVLSTVVHCT